jgi:hypothetical protein
MKNLNIIFLIALLSLAGCKQGNKNGISTDLIQNGKTPKMTFDQLTHDFGKISDDVPVTYDFDFTNNGDGDLIITNAQGACSCTVPEWPHEIIHPGGKGTIKVKFEPYGKTGINTKVVTIEANTNPKITKLEISADIYKAPEKQ